MTCCKYCKEKIEWIKENDKWIPLDHVSKLRHSCLRKNDIKINKIYCIDCVKLMKLMENETIDLTVTSPPYDKLRDYKGYDFNFKAIANGLFRITKNGGVVVWVVNDATIKGSETGTSFKQALYFKEIGFNLHDTMIYEKNEYIPLTHNRYEQCFEYMFILTKSRPHIFNPIMIPTKTVGTKRCRNNEKHFESSHSMRKRKCKTTVNQNKIHPNKFVYSVGKNDKTKHNAPFPEQLANDHIISWTNKGDVVFDPMCGSGTTCKMAYLNGRKYIGCDVSKEYCDIANQRIRDLKINLVNNHGTSIF